MLHSRGHKESDMTERLNWTNWNVCTNAHTCNGCLCPVQSQGQGPTQLYLLFSVHTLICNGWLCLNWEQPQSKRDWSRSPVRAGQHAVSGTGKQARALGSFQLVVSMLWLGLSKVCVCTLEEQSLSFLEPSGKPHWFSNQLKEAVRLQSWCSYYVTWIPNYPESIPKAVISPSLQGPQLAVWFQIRSLLFSSYHTLCGSFFIA